MIDLFKLRDGLHRRPGDDELLLCVIARAIAAESERDELKAKLVSAQTKIEALRPKLAYCESALLKAESKLDLNSDQNKVAQVPDYVTVSQVPDSKYAAGWNDCIDETIRLSSTPAQRITEQDLRNIIKSYMEICIPFKVSFESWMSAEGEVLLAKLNEHCEPVAEILSSECEVVQNNQSRYFSIACIGAVKPKLGDKLYLHPPVTANKAEVPSDVIYCKTCNDSGEIVVGVAHTEADSVEIACPDCSYAHKLPPLKDGE